MKSKEIIALLISAAIDAALTSLLTQILEFGLLSVVFIILINIILFGLLYLWYAKKIQKSGKRDAVLKEMGISTDEDLLKYRELHKNLDLLGVENCTSRLTDTPFIPERCMRNIKKTLFFMGVAGSKWVNDPPIYAEFVQMLRKVSAAQGEVRFLLLDPEGDGWKKLKALRRDNLSDSSYEKYKTLMQNYPCLKVRLYDPLPSFRLQFVDGEYVAVSRYKFEFAEYEKTRYGWDAPHLILQNEVQDLRQGTMKHFWSLYLAFQFLYDHIWEQSRELKP